MRRHDRGLPRRRSSTACRSRCSSSARRSGSPWRAGPVTLVVLPLPAAGDRPALPAPWDAACPSRGPSDPPSRPSGRRLAVELAVSGRREHARSGPPRARPGPAASAPTWSGWTSSVATSAGPARRHQDLSPSRRARLCRRPGAAGGALPVLRPRTRGRYRSHRSRGGGDGGGRAANPPRRARCRRRCSPVTGPRSLAVRITGLLPAWLWARSRCWPRSLRRCAALRRRRSAAGARVRTDVAGADRRLQAALQATRARRRPRTRGGAPAALRAAGADPHSRSASPAARDALPGPSLRPGARWRVRR